MLPTPIVVRAVSLAACSLSLFACASSGGGAPGLATEDMKENAIVHQVTQADLDRAHSSNPLSGTSATLWVNGLGCPQCATNIDLQLKRIRGVKVTPADLSTGKVQITMTGKNNPSPAQLGEVIEDAGFTLVKVEQP